MPKPCRDDNGAAASFDAGGCDDGGDCGGRRRDDDEIGRVLQPIDAWHGNEPVDLRMTRIDQMQRSGKSGLAQVAQNLAADRGFARACADQGNRSRRQDLLESVCTHRNRSELICRPLPCPRSPRGNSIHRNAGLASSAVGKLQYSTRKVIMTSWPLFRSVENAAAACRVAVGLLIAAWPAMANATTAAPAPITQIEEQVNEAVQVRENEPHFKGLTRKQRQERVEFVAGNVLFAMAHEVGHMLVSEMGLPVLGREEDAVDAFAVVTY